MANWIKKNVISVVRGDSLWTKLELKDLNGDPYVADPTDIIRFSLKTSTNDDEEPLVVKEIPPDTMELRLSQEDNDLPPGDYYYDIEATIMNGQFTNTVVGPCRYKITPQVGDKRRWP